jgi:hypothetical protein
MLSRPEPFACCVGCPHLRAAPRGLFGGWECHHPHNRTPERDCLVAVRVFEGGHLVCDVERGAPGPRRRGGRDA